MIYHLSIPAHDPWTVSSALADLLGPKASIHRFPIDPRGYFIIHDTKPLAAIEVYPSDLTLKPGKKDDGTPRPLQIHYQPPRAYTSTHFAIQSPLRKDEILAIANRYGFHSIHCPRGESFHVVEVWLENEFLVEIIAKEDEEDTIAAHNPALWGDNLRVTPTS